MSELIDFAKIFGLPLAMAIYALIGVCREKPWWVPGPAYRELKADADKKQAIIDRLTELSVVGARTTHTAVDLTTRLDRP